MGEFEKAIEEMIEGNDAHLVEGDLAYRVGAKWARQWVLKNDPVVKDLLKQIRACIHSKENIKYKLLKAIKDYKAAIK